MAHSKHFSLARWQIALGVGALSAIGIYYWYMKTGRRTALKDIKGNISIDETTNETEAEKTPLELALKYKNEGNTLFKSGKFDEAITMYNKAIEVCPEEATSDLATYYQNRAAAYENLKKWSSVIADCSKAIELNPKYEKALMRRAKALEVTKDWENCLDDITLVCLLQCFGNQTSLMMADRILKELGKEHAAEFMKTRTPVVPSKSFIKTYFSSFSEDPVYKELLEVGDPLGQGDLRGFLKAKLAFATERYGEVIPACTEEINSREEESPYLMEALSLRASMYFLTGEFEAATKDLTRIIESVDADVKIKVNALIKRSSIHMQAERQPECLEDFELAAKLGPNISDVYHHRGQVKLLMEKTDDAIVDFKKAVDLNPDFSVAYVQKCYSDYRHAMQTQDPELLIKCMEDFRKSVQKFPTCAETYVLYAQVLAERREFDQAESLYEKALEIDPENASIYVHRGLMHLQWNGKIEESIGLMRRAIEIDDKCEFAYETLGTVEVQRGNLLIAIDLFDKAIRLARSEMEVSHMFSLRDAAASQNRVTMKLGADMSKAQLCTS